MESQKESILKEFLTEIGDAIREIRGTKELINAQNMREEILAGGSNEIVKNLIDRSITEIVIPEGITEIGTNAFTDCSHLEKVIIPNSVTNIKTSAFYKCTSLTNITIPNGVTKIGDSAFWGCSKLTQIVIPNSVKTIGSSFIRDCTGLKNATFEEPCSITNINGMFLGCMSLEYLEVPSSVTNVGWAFSNCTQLTTIRMKSTTPPRIQSDSLDANRTPSLTTIEVPTEAVETYKAATNWSVYADLIVGYTEVELKTFEIWNALSNDYASTYNYREGMTWQEFVNSEHNTGSFTVTSTNEINRSGTFVYDSKSGASGGNSNNCIKSTDIINQDIYWVCASSTGGAN